MCFSRDRGVRRKASEVTGKLQVVFSALVHRLFANLMTRVTCAVLLVVSEATRTWWSI